MGTEDVDRRMFLKVLGAAALLGGAYYVKRSLSSLPGSQSGEMSPTLGPSLTPSQLRNSLNPTNSPANSPTAERVLSQTEIVEFDEKFRSYIATNHTPVILIPLDSDYFYDETRAVRVTELSGVTIDCQKLWKLETTDKKFITVAELPHSTGDKVLPFAVLGDPSSQKSSEVITSAYTYMGEEKVYHNKIYNMSTALAQIMDYQEKNGPFEKGKTYSYLDIIKLIPGYEYKLGFNVYKYKVVGGGVCTTASVLCKALYLAGATFKKEIHSPREYTVWVGPGDPAITIEDSDAAVNYVSMSEIHDFKFTPSQTTYIDVELSIMPNGRKVSEFTLPGDARMTYTVKITPTKPAPGRSEEILAKRDVYDKLAPGSSTPQDTLPAGLDSADKQNAAAHLVYPEVRTGNFTKELATDPALGEISEIRNILNTYVLKTQKYGAGTYLRNSDWYKKFVDSGRNVAKLENILKILDQNTYSLKGQPFQCGAYTVLLASIGSPLSPKSIFGYTINGGFAYNTADIVPWVIKNGSTDFVDDQGFKFKVIKNISEVNVGNLFVRYDDPIGHIGAVIGKKNVGGETVLLVTDANRRPGKVFIFEVDATNFDAIFGGPPWKKVTIS